MSVHHLDINLIVAHTQCFVEQFRMEIQAGCHL